jgi:integrase
MLTNTKIKSLKPKEKLYRELDSLGLYIEVNKSGRKTWRQRFYIDKKENMLTLGTYPEVSLLEARQARDHNRQLISLGIDPSKSEEDTNTASGQTFKEMFDVWHEHMCDNWNEKYAEDVIQRTERYLLPYIGTKEIDLITSKDMLTLFKSIEKRGVIDTLHKIKGIASRVFRHSVGMGVIETDPTRDLPSDIFKKKQTKHYSTITDPREIGGLLRMLDTYRWSPDVAAALKLAPHLFLRPAELAGLMWKEIDFNDNIIRIEPERMKMKRTHLVPMSKQVSSMLLSIKTNNDFVFISPRGRSRHITPESLRAGLRRLGLTNDDITTHGFRHMASTRLNELGFKSDVIERQLAHCETNKVKAAYNHAEYLQERKKMMQYWSDYLDKLKESGMTQELIIP